MKPLETSSTISDFKQELTRFNNSLESKVSAALEDQWNELRKSANLGGILDEEYFMFKQRKVNIFRIALPPHVKSLRSVRYPEIKPI